MIKYPEKRSSQHYVVSTKGIPVMPTNNSSTNPPSHSLPQLTHCRSFDSTYGQVLGTNGPAFSVSHSSKENCPEMFSGSIMPTTPQSFPFGQQLAQTARARPDLAAARSIDSHARQRTDKYIKTVRKSSRQKSRQERIARLDDAIFELEHMYQQLRLNDEELLDRAERRDLPSHLQLLRYKLTVENDNFFNSNHCDSAEPNAERFGEHVDLIEPEPQLTSTPIARSPSYPHSFNETSLTQNSYNRTPPMRRSAIPDLIGDDLAVRRLQASPLQGSKSTGDLLARHLSRPYMSHCAAYDDRSLPTTPVPNRKVLGQILEANPQLDDLSYRRLRQADAANVLPPPPPFGIPLQPIQFNPLHDYMHLNSNDSSPNKDTKIKRVLRKSIVADPHADDLARRSWRKDPNALSATLKSGQQSSTSQSQNDDTQVNTKNPYSNLLRSSSSSFFNSTEPIPPVNTKSVAASYLERCKQNLRPTRSLTIEEESTSLENNSSSKQKQEVSESLKPMFGLVVKSASSGHVSGRLFSRIQQNLQAFDKEYQIQPIKENIACLNTPKNRIYNRSTFEGQSSKSPSPAGQISRPPSSVGSPTATSAQSSERPSPVPSTPKGLIFRSHSSSNSPPSASIVYQHSSFLETQGQRIGEQHLENLLSNLNQVPTQQSSSRQAGVSSSEHNLVPGHSGLLRGKMEKQKSNKEVLRPQSAWAWSENERHLRPQVPFFARHLHPPEVSTSPFSVLTLKDAQVEEIQKKRHPLKHFQANLGAETSVNSSEYFKFVPPTPLKSQVNEIKQLFEAKTQINSFEKSDLPKSDLSERENSYDVYRPVGSRLQPPQILKQPTLPDSSTNVNQVLPSLEPALSSGVIKASRLFNHFESPPLAKSKSQPVCGSVKKQTQIDQKPLKASDTDGRKIDENFVSTGNKRNGNRPYRRRLHLKNQQMKIEIKNNSSSESQAEHETSSSSSGESAVFVFDPHKQVHQTTLTPGAKKSASFVKSQKFQRKYAK